MLEISIFCVILFAIGYWATLFIMGRREDVLHGEFVEAEPELMPAPTGMPIAVPEPMSVAPPKPLPVRPVQGPPPAAVSVADPIPAPSVASAAAAATVPPQAVASTPANTDALQSLLVSLKQELKNAAQI